MRDGGERGLETNEDSKSKRQDVVRSPDHTSIDGSHGATIPPASTLEGLSLII